jgi:hypothetical protein
MLRAHFEKLPKTLRELFEYSIVEFGDAALALTMTSSG